MSVSLIPAIPQTVSTASSCPMTTNVSASLASQVAGARAGLVCVSLSLARTEEPAQYPVCHPRDTRAPVSLVILGPTVKEACPAGSCHATTAVAVPSPKGEHAAPAQEVMADHSASIAAMTAAPPSLAITVVCALRKQASHTFTASVPVAG